MYNHILSIFPKEMRPFFEYVCNREAVVNEIRLRAEKPVLVLEGQRESFLDQNGIYTTEPDKAKRLDKMELEKLVRHICQYSLYAFEEELRQGYVTITGGHRIGMVGQVVTDGTGKIRTLKYICGINIRVAHQVIGVAEPLLPVVYRDGYPGSVLIVSPPGCGKTTLLRDMVRCLSDGSRYGAGVTVGVVDERSEIAGSYLGQPQNEVGMRTDVLDACPKGIGMMMLLRAMSPKVIAIDELGSEEELEAVRVAASCGSKVVATMHGDSMEDLRRRKWMDVILRERLFETVIFLKKENGKCMVKNIFEVSDGDWTCRERLDLS